jgi:hypothetical protein
MIIKFMKRRESKITRKTRKIEFCPVSFGREKLDHFGYLVDLSSGGAKIRLNQGEALSWKSDEELNMGIKTPYGESICKATILWLEKDDKGDKLGVKFTELASDKKDPLRCLIDSAF